MFSVFDFITVPTFLISWFPLDVGRFSNIGDGGVKVVEDPGTKKIIQSKREMEDRNRLTVA